MRNRKLKKNIVIGLFMSTMMLTTTSAFAFENKFQKPMQQSGFNGGFNLDSLQNTSNQQSNLNNQATKNSLLTTLNNLVDAGVITSAQETAIENTLTQQNFEGNASNIYSTTPQQVNINLDDNQNIFLTDFNQLISNGAVTTAQGVSIENALIQQGYIGNNLNIYATTPQQININLEDTQNTAEEQEEQQQQQQQQQHSNGGFNNNMFQFNHQGRNGQNRF